MCGKQFAWVLKLSGGARSTGIKGSRSERQATTPPSDQPAESSGAEGDPPYFLRRFGQGAKGEGQSTAAAETSEGGQGSPEENPAGEIIPETPLSTSASESAEEQGNTVVLPAVAVSFLGVEDWEDSWDMEETGGSSTGSFGGKFSGRDKFRTRLEENAKAREEVEAENRKVEEKLLAEKWHEQWKANTDAPPGPVPSWPRKVAKGDPTLMTETWAFLQTTYPENTAQTLGEYLNFKYTAGRSTHATFHLLRELCRKNGKPTIGREVTEKALKALRGEVRRAIENDVLKWAVADCTLDKLEQEARQVEDALHARELERADKTTGKPLSSKLQDLSLSSKSPGSQRESNKPRAERGPKERERRGRGKPKQALAAMEPPALGTGFKGNCFNCGEYGHTRTECKKKPEAKGPRMPGAVCKHCKRRDSHESHECWEAIPEKRPEKWRGSGDSGKGKPGAGGRSNRGAPKHAYAADAVEHNAPATEEFDPELAWSAVIEQPGVPYMGVYLADEDHELPEVRASTKAQRETTTAPRARGEKDRLAARAKEDRLRKGGPPPAFRPHGDRPVAAAEEAGGETRAEPEEAEGPAEPEPTPLVAQKLPPSFGEYSPNDPRYQGIESLENAGVQVHMLNDPKVGPQREVQVKRAAPFETLPPAYSLEVQASSIPLSYLGPAKPMRCVGGADDDDGEGDEDDPEDVEQPGVEEGDEDAEGEADDSERESVEEESEQAGSGSVEQSGEDEPEEEAGGAAGGAGGAQGGETVISKFDDVITLGENWFNIVAGPFKDQWLAAADPTHADNHTWAMEEYPDPVVDDDPHLPPHKLDIYLPPMQAPRYKGQMAFIQHLNYMLAHAAQDESKAGLQGGKTGHPPWHPDFRCMCWSPRDWRERQSWAVMHNDEFAGYITHWGREYVTRAAEFMFAKRPTRTQCYVLLALHYAGRSILEYCRELHGRPASKKAPPKPDLSEMVLFHRRLLHAWHGGWDDNTPIQVGPLPEEELELKKGDTHNRGRVIPWGQYKANLYAAWGTDPLYAYQKYVRDDDDREDTTYRETWKVDDYDVPHGQWGGHSTEPDKRVSPAPTHVKGENLPRVVPIGAPPRPKQPGPKETKGGGASKPSPTASRKGLGGKASEGEDKPILARRSGREKRQVAGEERRARSASPQTKRPRRAKNDPADEGAGELSTGHQQRQRSRSVEPPPTLRLDPTGEQVRIDGLRKLASSLRQAGAIEGVNGSKEVLRRARKLEARLRKAPEEGPILTFEPGVEIFDVSVIRIEVRELEENVDNLLLKLAQASPETANQEHARLESARKKLNAKAGLAKLGGYLTPDEDDEEATPSSSEEKGGERTRTPTPPPKRPKMQFL
ncbi:hypothetical protein KFL_003910020 [Klebsormidium nitens]|uniref:CCHC-type domain-containing protein n=1 Tax=Klebsormidium nitens TaxID=105231 RepID=A0A1Y1IGX2_KLENI|nr:hypothetical protein KFL_003910020 [Klebsormidium nitens]|eukprot:GAQ87976.1 hypothetical protein KFL_003910020 [Klebsormidium nitens]